MKILLATDAFPPVSGGSGWSTYELARGLRARGHEIVVVQPRPGSRRDCRVSFDGFAVLQVAALAPDLPFVRNYFKNERLYASLTDALVDVVVKERVDVVHGQHVLTCVPSIEAAHRTGIPAVCTVRDYWPVCYWSDLIHLEHGQTLCPECTPAMMMRCIRPRAGTMWPLAVPMVPYMRSNLARKRRGLAAADAIIAVSSTIATDLRTRAPELSSVRMEIIPNPVDLDDLRGRAANSIPPLDVPYALYLGKLAPNKGTAHLIEVAERARLRWPLVVAGDGPERPVLETAARQSACDIRFVGWVDRNAATAWLAHASLLIFPSRGPESLSRVLLEASALGIPIAAMNTGGTPDIIEHEVTGLLSTTPDELADHVRRLIDDGSMRQVLGRAARERAARFDSSTVVGRIERLYDDLRKTAHR